MYRVVNHEQGSSTWLAWRQDGRLTATASSIIMGLYPYGTTVYDLWAEKVGLVEREFKENDAILHGTNTEGLARTTFQESTGVKVEPICVESIKYPFMAASLDGFNPELGIAVEIKCPMFFASFKKQKLEVPPIYYSQCQHQMYILDLPHLYLWIFYNNSEALHKIEKDENFQDELLKRCILFNSLVKLKLEPPEELFLPYVY